MAPVLDVSSSEPHHNYLVGVPQRHWFLLATKGLPAVKKTVIEHTHLKQTLYQMLNSCLPAAIHDPCHLIFLAGKELNAVKSMFENLNI